MKPRVSQLAQSGATDQQVATFDLATGFWMPKTPAAGSAHVVQDEGAALTQRGTLNFTGAGVTATDDAVNGKTLITIPGGGGGAGELLMQDGVTAPPVPIENEARTDWLYAG